ncbi:MAG TPA: hypothetical protein DCP60_02825 [Psychrobacter sp.]|nr:hypothetical protein [Psychrobacter sp.]
MVIDIGERSAVLAWLSWLFSAAYTGKLISDSTNQAINAWTSIMLLEHTERIENTEHIATSALAVLSKQELLSINASRLVA